MKRHLIHRQMVVGGLGFVLGAGLVAGPPRPCFASLTLEQKILKAQSDLEFYGLKRDFFNQLTAKADSEFNAADAFKQLVWNPVKLKWLQYVVQLKKADGPTAQPVPFLVYLFKEAAIIDLKAR